MKQGWRARVFAEFPDQDQPDLPGRRPTGSLLPAKGGHYISQTWLVSTETESYSISVTESGTDANFVPGRR